MTRKSRRETIESTTTRQMITRFTLAKCCPRMVASTLARRSTMPVKHSPAARSWSQHVSFQVHAARCLYSLPSILANKEPKGPSIETFPKSLTTSIGSKATFSVETTKPIDSGKCLKQNHGHLENRARTPTSPSMTLIYYETNPFLSSSSSSSSLRS